MLNTAEVQFNNAGTLHISQNKKINKFTNTKKIWIIQILHKKTNYVCHLTNHALQYCRCYGIYWLKKQVIFIFCDRKKKPENFIHVLLTYAILGKLPSKYSYEFSNLL